MHYNTSTANEPLQDLDYFNIDGYKYDGFLGCSNAPVYRFVQTANSDVLLALKELKIKDEEDYQRVVNNFRTLQRIKRNRHPNIIEIYGFCKVVKQKAYGEDLSAYLIMEHCEGNLDDYIQMKKKSEVSFTLTEIKKFFSQTLSSLEFMQTNLSIAHRDIKPENILVHKTNFKIADLDDSKIDLNKTVEKSLVLGTLSFMAPELLKAYNRMKDRLSYNAYRSDVYSLGLCLLYMCTFHKFTRNERMDGVTNKSKYQEQIKTLRQSVKEKYGSVLSKLIKIMLEMDPILRPDFKTLKKNAIDRVFLEKSDFYSVENGGSQKREKISIDLNRPKCYENNLGRMKQQCILSDSEGGTTAHYSSDNQETSEGSQRAFEYYQSQQQSQYHYRCYNEQVHYNNLQSHLPHLSMQKQHSNPNARQNQAIQHTQKQKPLSSSSSHAQGGASNQYLRNTQGIDAHSRFSGGNFQAPQQQQQQINRISGQTFSFDQKRMYESNNLNRLVLPQGQDSSANTHLDNCQMSQSSGNNNNNNNIGQAGYLVNYNQIGQNQIGRNNQNRGGMYNSSIPEAIQEYNSVRNQDERSNSDRTISQQSNNYYQGQNNHENAIASQTMIESRTNSQQTQQTYMENSHKNNSLYPESQISDSKSVGRQNTFTVSEIIRENKNNQFQLQQQQQLQDNILSNQNYVNQDNEGQQQQQYIQNYNQTMYPIFHQDGEYYCFKDENDIVSSGKAAGKVLSSTDKSSSSQSKSDQRQSQKQKSNQNQRDITIYEDLNQNTRISQNNMERKKRNQNMVKIQEDENNFYETFLESSCAQTPHNNQNGLNYSTDGQNKYRLDDKKGRYYQFQNPDQIRKLSKQRKTLAIVIGVMILFTIALGLFYFIQQSTSSDSSSHDDDNGGGKDKPDDDDTHKTYTVEECRQLSKMYLQGKCYTKCPQQNYYPDVEQQICVQCDPSCLECTWGEANSCKKCKTDLYLLSLNSQTGMCVSDCPNYFRKDNQLNKCIKCPENCITCSTTSSSSSSSSIFKRQLVGQENKEMMRESVSGTGNPSFSESQVICNHCASEYYLLGDNLCINVCPRDTVTDQENRKCVTSVMHFTQSLLFN